MNPTREEADDAQRRLNEIANAIDGYEHQVAEDIRTLIARRLMLEEYATKAAEGTSVAEMLAPSLQHTPGQPTLGLPTVMDRARRKRAKALGDETPWGDSQ